MGSIIKNGILYAGGGGDASTVRYVSDEANENFDWLQVQDAEGNWVNFQRAYTQQYNLYVNGENGGEFSAYKGGISQGLRIEPKLTFDDGMNIVLTATTQQQFHAGSVISKKIDLSRFKTLKFTHSCSTNGGAHANRTVAVFITTEKAESMSATTSRFLLQNATTSNGNVEIDLSNLNGEYYIGIELTHYMYNTTSTSTKITNMIME